MALSILFLASGLVFGEAYQNISEGTAPITCTEGYKTVNFSNGASYYGQFSNCKPVSGWGKYSYEGIDLSGYFTASGDDVVLEKDGYRIVLSVVSY